MWSSSKEEISKIQYQTETNAGGYCMILQDAWQNHGMRYIFIEMVIVEHIILDLQISNYKVQLHKDIFMNHKAEVFFLPQDSMQICTHHLCLILNERNHHYYQP